MVQREAHRGHSWLTAKALQAIDAKGEAWLACKGGGASVLGAAEAQARYTTLKNLAGRLVRRDKRAHWDARARALEDAFRDHNLHYAYKHLKTLGVDKEVPVTTLKDSEGNVLTDPEAVHAAWKELFEVLLNCRRDILEGVYEELPVCPADSDFMVEMPPSRLKVSWGLQAVLNYKSAGICGIKGEMLKRGGSNLVTLLHQLITAIWETGHMRDQWREGIIAPIWKAGDKSNVQTTRKLPSECRRKGVLQHPPG